MAKRPNGKRRREPWASDSSESDVAASDGSDAEDPFGDEYDEGVYDAAEEAAEQADAIDAVCDYRGREGPEGERLPTSALENVEFYIKWQGYSHIHNTWETFEHLKPFKGFKRLENYVRSIWRYHEEVRRDPHATREDLEAIEIVRSRVRDQIEGYRQIERIVAERSAGPNRDIDHDHVEYLCKWHGQFYAEATWEALDLVESLAPGKIDEFRIREANEAIPERSVSYKRGRPPFAKMSETPSYLAEWGNTLKDFQLTGLNWLAYLWTHNLNGILADEMGLGKTVQTCSFISWLFHERQLYGPFLLVVPLSTLPAWHATMDHWGPALNTVVFTGNAPSRDLIKAYEFGPGKQPKFNVLLTTYEFALKDKSLLSSYNWQFIAVDEAHRLKNADSQLYEALFSFKSGSKLLITGTPLQNNVKELLALMHFLEPEKYPLGGEFDLSDSENEAKIRHLHSQLETMMLRRLKKDVIKELPTKSERILRVGMSNLQTWWYKNILTKNYNALTSKGGDVQVSLLNVAVELKKAANHPFLFDGVEEHPPPGEIPSREDQLKGLVMNSGKMVLLDKLMQRLKQDGHRVLIFSQMVRMLDILSDYLALRGYVFQRLDGTVGSEQRRNSIARFNAPDSPDFAFILSTRAGGLGINLETADTVIIFDSDWNPQNDLQAMARAHRIGQKNHVNVYRFLTKDTVEEDILERARKKMVLEYAIVNQMDTSGTNIGSKKPGSTLKPENYSKEELSSILKFGAASLFKTDKPGAKLEELDLDDVINQAENFDSEGTQAGQQSHLGSEDFLATVQDVNTDTTQWDDIIPPEQLAKMKEEREEVERRIREKEEQERREREEALKAQQAALAPQVKEEDEKPHVSPASSSPAPASSQAPPRKTPQQRARILSPRELRVLIRAIQRFGDIHDRFDAIVKDARLERKDPDYLIEIADDLVQKCVDKLESTKRDIERRRAAGENVAHIPASRARAVMVTFNGVSNINAETVVQRVEELKLLHKYLGPLDNPLAWIFPVVGTKATQNWSCPWNVEDDSRLLIGCWRWGLGNWEAIQRDPDLGLQHKFFLEDAKLPRQLARERAKEGKGTGTPLDDDDDLDQHDDDHDQPPQSETSEPPKAPESERAPDAAERAPDAALAPASSASPLPPSGDAGASSPAAPAGGAVASSPGGGDLSALGAASPSGGSHKDASRIEQLEEALRSKERNIPNSVHLVRRSDYLLKTLLDYDKHLQKMKDSGEIAPAPTGKKGGKGAAAIHAAVVAAVASANARDRLDQHRNGHDSHSRPHSPPRKKQKKSAWYTSSESEDSGYESMDDDACKEMLRPVKNDLKRLKRDTADLEREQKLAALKECLTSIGRQIEFCVQQHPDLPSLRKHLWVWSSHFFPNKVHWTKLQALHDKLHKSA